MDQTTYMIFDELTGNLGRDFSIHSLTNEIKKDHNRGHYKNIYDRIKDLKKSNDIILDKIGKSLIIRLNFESHDLLSLLSQFELIKKRESAKKDKELGMLISDMDAKFGEGFFTTDSICMIDPEGNKKVNRAEILIIQKDIPRGHSIEGLLKKEMYGIFEIIKSLERMHNIKIDHLILSGNEFDELIAEKDHNPLKQMLSSRIILANQENFWHKIKRIFGRGISIKSSQDINPAKISEENLIYNLSRFGYKELGAKIEAGKGYCIEMIIASLLLKNDARRIEAIPILVRKNLETGRRPIFSLLIFLAKKYNRSGELFGLLRSSSRYCDDRTLADAVEFMEKTGIVPKDADEHAIKQKMRLYHGN